MRTMHISQCTVNWYEYISAVRKEIRQPTLSLRIKRQEKYFSRSLCGEIIKGLNALQWEAVWIEDNMLMEEFEEYCTKCYLIFLMI